MRPVRIVIAAVVLSAAAAAAGSYLARSTSHPAAGVAPTTTSAAAKGAKAERAGRQDRTGVTHPTGSTVPTTRTTSVVADRISDPQVVADRLVTAWIRGDQAAARELAGRAVTAQLFRESPPNQAPATEPCRLAEPALFVCSYPIAEHAELSIFVHGGASAGYRATGVEFGD